jgi:ABC-type glycerol-3-phosphate transport system substrate-binding protein
MGYFQFPIIDANVPTAEDGPVESLHIPSKAKNKADAHTFLAFVETPEIGAKLAAGLGSLSANSKSPEPEDPISKIGFQILANTKGGIAQFYDRDMTHEGNAAVRLGSDEARQRARATGADAQAHLQEVVGGGGRWVAFRCVRSAATVCRQLCMENDFVAFRHSSYCGRSR